MTRYESIDVVSEDDAMFEEPAWKRLITLVSVRGPSLERAAPSRPHVPRHFPPRLRVSNLVAGPLPSQVNIGLLLFAAGGLTYLTEGWDPTAFLCTAGYVMCGLGLALPSCVGSAEETKLRICAPGCGGLYRFVGTILNILGLLMGIVGSLMYSPTVNEWLYKLDEEEEHEWMREFANVIWAVSFFLFPAGVGLFLAERARDVRRAQRRAWKTTPGFFSQKPPRADVVIHHALRMRRRRRLLLLRRGAGGGAHRVRPLRRGGVHKIRTARRGAVRDGGVLRVGRGGRSREDGGVGERTPLTRDRGVRRRRLHRTRPPPRRRGPELLLRVIGARSFARGVGIFAA